MSKSPLECSRNGASRRVLDFHCRLSYKLFDGLLEWRTYFDRCRFDFPAAVCFSFARPNECETEQRTPSFDLIALPDRDIYIGASSEDC